MMGCDDALSAQDQWLAEVLARPGEVSVDGEEVTLTFGDTVLVMAELDSDATLPPAGGRAPGRDAGLIVARRQARCSSSHASVRDHASRALASW
jgi:hypothetical protein